MFKLFGKNKKTKIQELIEQDGIENATQRFAEVISDMLKTKELAYQFILEEIEAASQGNQAAIEFSSQSGISSNEYKGSMRISCPAIDGAEGPQQFLLNVTTQLHSDTVLMIEFRTKIVDKVMRIFMLGKYTNSQQLDMEKYVDPDYLYESSENTESHKEEMGEESIEKQNDIISKLSKLSKSNSIKKYELYIRPVNDIWSWSFEFSEEELESADKLVNILDEIRKWDLIAIKYYIAGRQESSKIISDDDIPW